MAQQGGCMRPLSGSLSMLLLVCHGAPVWAMEEVKVPAPKITVLTPDACQVEYVVPFKAHIAYTEHQVPLKYFGECGTLQPILDNCDFSKPIPLPNISTPAFPLVLAALKAQYVLSNARADAAKLESAQLTLESLGSCSNKLYTLLMASNYLDHGKLYAWCKKQYARHITAQHKAELPMEIEVAVARELLEKTSICVDMPCWAAQSIPINTEGTIQLTANSLWLTVCNQAGNLVLCGDNEGELYVYDIPMQTVQQFRAHQQGITALEFVDEDVCFLTAAQDGMINFWDTASQNLIQTLVCNGQNPYVCKVSPCQKKIAYNEDQTLILQERDSLAIVRFEGHEESIQDIVFYRKGMWIASGSKQNVKLWDIAQQQCKQTINLNTSAVRSLQISPDETLLSVGTKNGCIAVYCLDTFEKKCALFGHTDTVWAMHISPDNQCLVSGSVDQKIKIWYLPQQAVVKELGLHDAEVHSMSLHSSGMLASVSLVGKLNLCNLHELFWRVSHCIELLKKPLTIAQAYIIKMADEAYETESVLFESEPSEDAEDVDTHEQRENFLSLDSDLQNFLVQKWGYKLLKKL